MHDRSDMRHDRRLLLLHEDDNVYVACGPLAAGTDLSEDEGLLVLTNNILLGHKVARRTISKGDIVYKYGAPIGSATANIAPGDHVHVHNLQSDYIVFHGHQEKT